MGDNGLQTIGGYGFPSALGKP